MKIKNLFLILATVLAGSASVSFMVVQDQKTGSSWTIPDEYKTMKMPAGSEAMKSKMIWAVHCKSCHGNTGLGDGLSAVNLNAFPGNFKSAGFQEQSDGTIYYQSFVGRDEMPNFEKKIPDDTDRWNLVAFIRTLK